MTEKRVEILLNLSEYLKNIPENILYKANIENPWFTFDFIKLAANNWSEALNKTDVLNWLKEVKYSHSAKNIGIIMAGNIPFVGLHDLLSVLVTGNRAFIKLSSQDEVLMKFILDFLSNTELNNFEITEKLNHINALIATGSNSTSNYIEYYFRNIPKILRKNRTSLAILSGNESKVELENLSDDIYQYFGLGCRNVTHLILPRNVDFHLLYTAFDKYMNIIHHHKYYNNYTYHKAILLMNLTKHYDHGFMLFQEKQDLHTPISTLNYHFYDHIEEVENYIKINFNELQCITSNMKLSFNTVGFGETQKPKLYDYSDNVNTLEFLTNL